MKTIIGIIVLWAILWGVQYGLGIIGFYNLPAPIVAMALLTSLLFFSKHAVNFLSPAAGTLIQYMPLFFIPVLVGVMVQQELIAAHWVLIMFTIIATTLLGLVSAALIYTQMIKPSSNQKATQKTVQEQPHD